MLDRPGLGAEPQVTAEELANSSGCASSLDVHQVSNIGGPALSSEVLTQLHDCVAAAQESGQPAIVTLGTDAIEEVAFFLYLVINPRVPVVLTGAMRTHDHPEADGPGNIADSLHLILDQPAPGVYVYSRGRLLPGHRVVKAHTADLGAFALDPTAGTDRMRLPFNGFALPTLIVKPGLMDDLAFIPQLGLKALVVEAFGEGNVPARAEDAILSLLDQVPVLVTTRVRTGPLGTTYGYAGGSRRLIRAGVIPSRWPSPKLRLLASLAVAAYGPAATEYLRAALT